MKTALLTLAVIFLVDATILTAPRALAGDVPTSVLSIDRRSAESTDKPRLAAGAARSPLVELILNSRADIRDRLEAAQEIGGNLNRADVEAFFWFLKGRPDGYEKNLPGLRALKNNVINALRSQKNAPAGLTATLIDIFHDHKQDLVIRDYAVQHLTSWYMRSPGDSPDAKEQIQMTLMEALAENTRVAGTALLGLQRLSAIDGAIKGDEINRSAIRMATSSNTVLATRITAIQICAERGLAQAIPAIKRCAETRGQPALQISAIGAMERLGSIADLRLLNKLASEDDTALRPAITMALRRLSEHRMIQQNF